jgi:hypothetical protein
LKIFIDNVIEQAVERHILEDFRDIFDPAAISKLDDDLLIKITRENEWAFRKRAELQKKREVLVMCHSDLVAYHIPQVSRTIDLNE